MNPTCPGETPTFAAALASSELANQISFSGRIFFAH